MSCVARKGGDGQKSDEKEVGFEETDENDAMSEESFASAESQGWTAEEGRADWIPGM